MVTAHELRRMIGCGLAAVAVLCAVESVAAECARTCAAELTACKRTRCADTRGRARRRCLARCRSTTGCGDGVGTMAYVVSRCRVRDGRMLGSQELRVRRGRCDPITVARFANFEPITDPGLCALLAGNHSGLVSSLAGVFQRLGVSQDGSAVVFEVSNEFQLIGPTPLAAEQQGLFWVRADGTGLRRLGPPSRDPVYRVFPSPRGASAASWWEVLFSGDGARIVFTDIGPGADGPERDQVFVLELATGERRQLTHLRRADSVAGPWHNLIWLYFLSPDRVTFLHDVGDGTGEVWAVNVDGTGLERLDLDRIDGPKGGPIRTKLGISKAPFWISEAYMPGAARDAPEFPPVEIFRRGEYTTQLTNFGRWDTALLGYTARDVVFSAAVDPLGTNPSGNCQLFRVSPFGEGLRQLTRFGDGTRPEQGCRWGGTPGCMIDRFRYGSGSHSVAFYSDCDPFGTNPDGSQVFAIEPDGSRLRQLTHTAGVRRDADGTLDVEMPGPVSFGGR